MHIGEALILGVPVAVLFFLEFRKRRREKRTGGSAAGPEDIGD